MALKKKWLQRSALNEVRKKRVFKSTGLCKGGGGGRVRICFKYTEWNQWQTLSRKWLYLIYVLEDDSDYYSFWGEGWSTEIGKQLECQTIHDEENA